MVVKGMNIRHSGADVLFEEFASSAREAILSHGGRFRDCVGINFHKKVNHWWNSECDKSMQEKRASFRNFISQPSLLNWQTHKAVCKRTKSKIHSVRNSSYRDFCESLNLSSDSGRIWRTLKSFKNIRSSNRGLVSEGEKVKAKDALRDLCRVNSLCPANISDTIDSNGFLPPDYVVPLSDMTDHDRVSPRSDPSVLAGIRLLFLSRDWNKKGMTQL